MITAYSASAECFQKIYFCDSQNIIAELEASQSNVL